MSEKKPLRRYLDPTEFTTPAQHARHLRGERVENPAYTARRAEALKRAGLEDEGAVDGDALTPADHYRAIRRG